MKIAFWLTTPKKVVPDTIDEIICGGCERSALNLAHELCKINDSAPMFFANVCERGSVYNLGHFLHYDDLKKCADTIDVLVCVRADSRVLNPRYSPPTFGYSRPKKLVLWSGDSYDQPNNEIFHDIHTIRNIDKVLLKGNWQKETWLREFPLLTSEKVEIVRKGVNVDWLPSAPSCVTEPKFIYASTPYRGLHLFLKIWPEIKKRIPNATLDCYCKTTLYLDDNPRESDFDRLYEKIAELPDVTIKDPLPQQEFFKVLPTYAMMLYPNSGWEETVGGVVLESMACGVPVITSHRAGLKETLDCGGGFGIVGDPESELYKTQFADLTLRLFEKQNTRNEKAKVGFEHIRKLRSWSKMAKHWMLILDELVGITEKEPEYV